MVEMEPRSSMARRMSVELQFGGRSSVRREHMWLWMPTRQLHNGSISNIVVLMEKRSPASLP